MVVRVAGVVVEEEGEEEEVVDRVVGAVHQLADLQGGAREARGPQVEALVEDLDPGGVDLGGAVAVVEVVLAGVDRPIDLDRLPTS